MINLQSDKMLKQLQIKNYALIKELTFDPSSDLNTITGETGAGKSIMLGAIGLILGQRADSKALLDETSKCIIEGQFEIGEYQLNTLFDDFDLDYEPTCIIRREIAPTGKSRAFINDTPTTLDVLKEIGQHLLDIHSQHDTLFLKKKDVQLQLVDAYAQTSEALTTYHQHYAAYVATSKKLTELKASADKERGELDYNSFLLKELDELQPIANEETLLKTELDRIENAEDIQQNLSQALQLIETSEINASNILFEAIAALKQIQHLSDDYESLFSRLQSTHLELQDIAKEISNNNDNSDIDFSTAEEIKLRYDSLQRLLTKHHVETAEELLLLQDELSNKVKKVTNIDDEINLLETLEAQQLATALKSGNLLSKLRSASFSSLENEIAVLLHDLGMPEASLKFEHQPIDPQASGIDQIELLFSANKGVAPVTLKQAASGGEMSRLMFAVKFILAQKVALPTIIFDEIDTGISGEIALSMGEMMQKMATHHQVITITHLPQIASKGSTHFYVYKDDREEKTISNIKELGQEERISEIAIMIGGKNPSDNAYSSAKELLGA